MKKLILLLKVHALNVFGLNRMRYGHDSAETKKAKRTFLLMAFVAVMLVPSIYMYFYGIGLSLKSMGSLELLMAIAAAAGSVAVLITTIVNAANTLFCFRDFDATVSLPIPLRTVVISRILRLYATNFFFMLFIMIPALVAYATLTAIDVMFVLRFIIAMLFLPAIPVIIASLVSTLIARVSVHSRKKSIVSTVLLMIFVLAMMVLSFMSQSIAKNFDSIMETLTAAVQSSYPPAIWFSNAVCSGDLSSFGLFIGISLAVYIVFTLLVSKLFKRLNAVLTSSSAKRRAAKAGDIKASSQFSALLKKESTRYFASSVYVANTFIGEVLLVLAGALLLIVGREQVFALLLNFEGFEGAVDVSAIESLVVSLVPYAVMFFMGISVTTTVCISIEGRNLWQIKSLPIAPRTLFSVKLLFAVLIALPSVLFFGICTAIALSLDIVSTLTMIVLPSVFTVFMCISGLYINLRHARFDWKSDAEVVKQSTPVLLNMLIGMAFVIVPLVLILAIGVPSMLIAGILTALFAILSIVLWRLTVTKGVKRFNNFN